ncbi:hypothetical protein PYCC9005_004725 [Savitreella phatthalungensis]
MLSEMLSSLSVVSWPYELGREKRSSVLGCSEDAALWTLAGVKQFWVRVAVFLARDLFAGRKSVDEAS